MGIRNFYTNTVHVVLRVRVAWDSDSVITLNEKRSWDTGGRIGQVILLPSSLTRVEWCTTVGKITHGR